MSTLITSCGVQWYELQNQIDRDPFIAKLKADILAGNSHPKGYSINQGVLRFKGRLVIPERSQLVKILLHEYHDSPLGGHSGDFKTYQRLAREWYWPGMHRKVQQYVLACPTCQQQKTLPIPSQIWEDVSIDFVEGLSKSQGYDTVLVVVDRLSKYSHFIGLKHPFTAASVAQKFIQEVVKHHGFPATIVSDRDRIFLSLFRKELFKLQGTQLNSFIVAQLIIPDPTDKRRLLTNP